MEDDLKKQWNDTRFRDPDPESIDNALLGRKRTALQSLEKRYRQFSIMSLVAICFCILFAKLMPEGTRSLFMILMAVYFFTASMMDLWLSNGISKIDCSTMRVSEVAKKVMLYRKRHFPVHGNSDSRGAGTYNLHDVGQQGNYRRCGCRRAFGRGAGDSRISRIHEGLSRSAWLKR